MENQSAPNTQPAGEDLEIIPGLNKNNPLGNGPSTEEIRSRPDIDVGVVFPVRSNVNQR